MPDQESETVAKTFVRKIVSMWGVPRHMLTDQGTNFTSKTMAHVYDYLGTKRRSTTAYHPQCNGLVERYNRTLKDVLAKLIMQRRADWDELLDWAVACYRATPNVTIQDTPYFTMLGRDPVLPMNECVDDPWDDDYEPDPVKAKPSFLRWMDFIASETKVVIDQAQKGLEQRERHQGRGVRALELGCLVKLREMSPGKRGQKGTKLQPKYTGPYRLVAFGEKSSNVVIVELKAGVTKHVSVSQVERYWPRHLA